MNTDLLCWATSPALYSVIILRQDLFKSLNFPGYVWTCDFLATASQTAGIITSPYLSCSGPTEYWISICAMLVYMSYFWYHLIHFFEWLFSWNLTSLTVVALNSKQLVNSHISGSNTISEFDNIYNLANSHLLCDLRESSTKSLSLAHLYLFLFHWDFFLDPA